MPAHIVDPVGDQKDCPLRVLCMIHVIQRENQRVVNGGLAERFGVGLRVLEIGGAHRKIPFQPCFIVKVNDERFVFRIALSNE